MGLLALCWRGDISVVSTLLTSLKQLGVGLAIRERGLRVKTKAKGLA
jgi:hypothetical protein